ncbi:hypothetical protein JK628_16265 [Shewanella sp. KX20019]|uniref:hypothetical protein n=1 Tax=Shewanella sp. KX20019 TaxID=2803864 RepID=UPI001925F9E4|nr:hypothetical protein [Shewanella sp. KX20019]QQX79100.1 hypothetical protein JK628_16265 [Shewanella sp. KX20019]
MMKNIILVGFILCASGLLALPFNANSGLKHLEGEPDWQRTVSSSTVGLSTELEKQRLDLLMKQLEEERKKEEEQDSKG